MAEPGRKFLWQALGENFHAVQKHVGKGVTICAVVKADGYGHGAVECARALESEGADGWE